MASKDLSESIDLLGTFDRGERPPQTIEESLADSLVHLTAAELCDVARKVYRRGFDETLDLIHAEFLRRRDGCSPVAA